MEQRVMIAVKVTPSASQSLVLGWESPARQRLLVRVAAAPKDGQANNALIRIMAESLGLPKSRIRLVRGQAAKSKLLSVEVEANRFEQWADNLAVIRQE